uniref:Uncharacterized protein n=1 Tax=Arundo donax TaxID=35708 RepID=A0A0A9C4R7_ARUDO
MRLQSVLESRSITNWRLKVDYRSPIFYDYLVTWFSLLASSYMKSLSVEKLTNYLSVIALLPATC